MEIGKLWLSILSLATGVGLWAGSIALDGLDWKDATQFQTLADGRFQLAGDGITLDVPAKPQTSWNGVVIKPKSGKRFDFSDGSVLAMDVRNLTDTSARLEIEIVNLTPDWKNYAHRVTGGIGLAPRESGVMRVRYARAGNPGVAWAPVGMRSNFDGFDRVEHHFDQHLKTARVDQLRIFVKDGAAAMKFEIRNIRLEEPPEPLSPALDSVEAFYPCIDRFGQYKHATWPNKIENAEDLTTIRIAEDSDLAAHPEPSGRDRFGGLAGEPVFKATGNFYPTKFQGKWFLVDPAGRLFWSYGLNSIDLQNWTAVSGREHYFEDIPEGEGMAVRRNAAGGWYANAGYPVIDTVNFQVRNCMAKYGAKNYEDVWEIMLKRFALRLKSWGVNTIGNWSDSRMLPRLDMPYVFQIGDGAPMIRAKDMVFYEVFSPAFEKTLVDDLTGKYHWSVNDPNCIGFFSGNEISWGDPINLVRGAIRSPAGQPSKTAFAEDLKARYGTVEKLNAAWGGKYAGWDAFLECREMPDLKRAWNDLTRFNSAMIERYFETVRRVADQYAPGKLYLGCRLLPENREDVVKTAAKYTDVLSFNLYRYSVGDFQLPAGVDKPVLIGEWHFGTANSGPPNPGQCPTSSQEERARAFDRYLTSALNHPLIVGAHYFACNDQAATSRWFDLENMQFGFLDIADTPYQEVIDVSRKLGQELYQIRLGGNPKSKTKGK